MKTKNLLVSKAEEHINNQNYTTAQLVNGEWISIPVNHSITINNPTVIDLVKRAAK